MEYVRATPEFQRIKNLPRREFDPADPELLEICDALTEYLKTPEGTQRLLPIQAFILRDLYEHRGFIGSVPVGNGKTHPCLLAPTLLEAERPLLIVPAKHVRQKTPRQIEQLSRHWRIHPDLQVISYEKLGVDSGTDLLFDLRPDLIILDEMQYVKNRQGVARTKRIERYIRAHRTVILGLSGTFIDYSLMQGWHLLYWALPYTTPLPRRYLEVKQWARAVEEDPFETGVHPGVLEQLAQPGEDLTDAVGRRIASTPGVVAVPTSDASATLTISGLWPSVPAEINDALSCMRATWETPGGEPFEMAVDLWRHARELACGFYRRYVEEPSAEWLQRRRAWSSLVREALQSHRRHNGRAIDTAYQVALAASDGALPSQWCAAYAAWKEIEPACSAATEPVWISNYMVEYCAAWLAEHERGIAWCDLRPFAERLSKFASVPYYSNQGRAADGEFIEDGRGPCIASPIAVKDGYNLQHSWSDNLFVSYPPSNETLEQVIGRTHRQFQLADEVTAAFIFTTPESVDAFRSVYADAKKYTTILSSKLLYADYVGLGFDL